MVLTPHRAVQPDVIFIANPRLHIIGERVEGPADLVAEVLSPASRRRDRLDKRDLYEQHGVKEYWLLDPEALTVEVLFLERGEYRLVGRWQSEGQAVSRLLPGFKLSNRQLPPFGGVRDAGNPRMPVRSANSRARLARMRPHQVEVLFRRLARLEPVPFLGGGRTAFGKRWKEGFVGLAEGVLDLALGHLAAAGLGGVTQDHLGGGGWLVRRSEVRAHFGLGAAARVDLLRAAEVSGAAQQSGTWMVTRATQRGVRPAPTVSPYPATGVRAKP
jgi:hypothetical protein